MINNDQLSRLVKQNKIAVRDDEYDDFDVEHLRQPAELLLKCGIVFPFATFLEERRGALDCTSAARLKMIYPEVDL